MKTAKSWYIAASIVTVAVVLLVGAMNRITIPTPDWWDVSGLPLFHAVLNSIAAILILLGGIFIKLGKKKAHRGFMMSAFTVSGVFLLSYVTYHFTSETTYYGDLDHSGKGLSPEEEMLVASTKTRYYVILLTHILFAIISFPLILFSIIAAFFQQFSLHKKLTRWAYPMWLYVAVTGPIVYYMISPYY